MFGKKTRLLFACSLLLLTSCWLPWLAAQDDTSLNTPLPPKVTKARYVYSFNGAYTGIFTANPTGGLLRSDGNQLVVGIGPAYYTSTIDVAGKFLFARSDDMCDPISVWALNATTGRMTLVPGSPFQTFGHDWPEPDAITVTPNGKFLYASSVITSANCATGNNISAFAVDQTTGVLTAVPGSPFSDGNEPIRTVVDKNGKFLYASSGKTPGSVSVFSIDATTGALTPISGSPFAGRNLGSAYTDFLALTPSNSFLYTFDNLGGGENISVFAINGTTGAPAEVTGSPFAGSAEGLTGLSIDPSSRFLYGSTDGKVYAFTLNPTSGVPAPVAGSPFSTLSTPFFYPIAKVAYDPTGSFAYAPNAYLPEIQEFTINKTTGALTKPVSIRTEDGPTALLFTTGTANVKYVPKFAYAANSGSNSISEYSIGATGALTEVIGSPLTDTNGPNSVTTTLSGNFVYTVNQNHTLSGYSVGSSGALTKISSSPFSGFQKPIAAIVDPSDASLVVLDQGTSPTIGVIWTLTIASDGSLTVLGNPGVTRTTFSAFAMDPTGSFLFVADSGANTLTSGGKGDTGVYGIGGPPSATGTNPVAVAVRPIGDYVYVANSGSNNVSAFRINDGTNGNLGSLTKVTGSPFAAGTAPSAILAEPSGKFLYVANSGSDTISAFKINATTGALAKITGTFSTGTAPDSLSVSNDGKFLYASNKSSGSVSVFTINANGTLTAGTAAVTGTSPTSIASTGVTQ